jgi:putative Mg2+ transporter-C (MgtC) family protein
MTDWLDIIMRLGSAALIGGAIGLNRDLHHKPSGLRTLSIVGLGSALAVLAVAGDTAAASRIIQGLVTGIGFLGAGVILRDQSNGKVHGLTTAAAVWTTACLGAACGLGQWRLVIVAAVIMAVILAVGGRVEKAVHRALDGEKGADDGKGTP